MPEEIKIISNRSARWKRFLNETAEGKDIRDCVLASNPGWKNVDMIADKVSGYYGMSSDPSHATSHEIHADKSIELQISSRSGPQAFNLMTCIGTSLQLRITRN